MNISRMPLALFVSCVLFVGAQATGSYAWHPSSGFTLGVGFDPQNIDLGTHNCFEKFTTENVDVGGTGAVETNFDVVQIQSSQQLYDMLKVDVKINARSLFVSGSASVNYENEYSFSQDSLTWMVRAYSDYGRLRMVEPKLLPKMQKLLDDKKFVSFKNSCGSEYIAMQRKAALVAVVFSVTNVSSETRKKLEAMLQASASFVAFQGDLASSYKQAMNSAFQSSTVKFNFFARGGKGMSMTSGLVTSVDDLRKLKENVAQYVASINVDNAVPTEFISQSMSEFGYEGTSALVVGDEFLKTAYFKYRDSEDVVKRLTEIVNKATTEYSFLSKDELEAYRTLKADHVKYLESIKASIAKCDSTPKNCVFLEAPATPIYPHVSIIVTSRTKINPSIWRIKGFVLGGGFDETYRCDPISNSIVTLKAGAAEPVNLVFGNDKYPQFLKLRENGKQEFDLYINTASYLAIGATPTQNIYFLNGLGKEVARSYLWAEDVPEAPFLCK